jgi:GntR family transcriptional regulator
MRLWLARNSGISLREQLVSQIALGILCRDLAPGQRLPSTRELARRVRVHTNTVSAAYRELARRGWVEFRRGSGVYVPVREDQFPVGGANSLDRDIAAVFRRARERGVSLTEVRARIRHWLELQPPDHWLVIEADPELRRILVAELREAMSLPISGVGPEALRQRDISSAVCVFLSSRVERIRGVLPADTEHIALDPRSVPESLAAWTPIPRDALIGVASRWPDFLKWARTMLLTAGAEPEALVLRDARRSRWREGLRQTTVVIADILTARQVPRGCRVIPFAVIADSSLEKLRAFETSLTRPLS